MVEKVVIGDAELYLGDCREVMPTLDSADLLLTDPPYGLGDRMQGGTWGANAMYKEMRQWDAAAPDLGLLDIAIGKARHCIIWGGNYFALPPSRGFLSWSKPNAVRTMADFELAWTNLDQNAKQFTHPCNGWERHHPTQKPVELMAWCIAYAPRSNVRPRPVHGLRHYRRRLRQDRPQVHRH